MVRSTSDKVISVLAENSRISTKEIGKRLKISQQAASYHVKRIFDEGLASPLLLADSSRLGQVHMLFGFVTRLRKGGSIRTIIAELERDPLVTTIITGQYGLDLLVEYSGHTISAINKRHLELLARHSDLLETKLIEPVIVRRWYGRTRPAAKRHLTILAGDRQATQLTDEQRAVLFGMSEDTRAPLRSLAAESGIGEQHVRRCVRELLERRVIRGYSLVLHPTEALTRRQVFLRFSNEGVGHMEAFNEIISQMTSVVSVTKLLGEYHAMLHIEGAEPGTILDELRSRISIDDALVMPVKAVQQEAFFARI